jgi:hypothetical protein
MTTHIELVTAKTVRISTAYPNERIAGKCGRIAEWAPLRITSSTSMAAGVRSYTANTSQLLRRAEWRTKLLPHS